MKSFTMLTLTAVAVSLLGTVVWDARARAEAVTVARAHQHLTAAEAALGEVLTARWPGGELGASPPSRPDRSAPWEERVAAARRAQAWDAARSNGAPAVVVHGSGGPWLIQTVDGKRRALPWATAVAHVEDRASGQLVLDGSGQTLGWPVGGPDGPVTFVPTPAAWLELAPYSDLVRTLLAALALGAVGVAQVRARAQQQTRDTLMQRLSHDLRTPAASVRSLAAALRSGAVSAEERGSFLELLDQEATRLAGGLDRMLRAARGEPLVLQRTPTDLAEWIEQVHLRWSPRLPGLTLQAPESLPWRADRSRLDEAVDALLDNAAKHGGPTVSLALRAVDGHAELRVFDDGAGVPAASRARVFDRLARGDAPEQSPGHGLGLWAAREVAEAHGGRLVLEGNATFVLTLGER